MLWLKHTNRTECSIIFAKIRQSKMLTHKGLIKKCGGWECKGFHVPWDRIKERDDVNTAMIDP
jgi:hypothetical protein